MLPVYIAGCGMTEFGRRREGLVELMREAAARALRDSPVAEIDAIYVAAMNPEEFTGDGNLASGVLDALGLTGLPALRVETASSSGAAAFHAAFEAIASGHYRHVLVIGGKKMTHLSTSATTKILAEVIDAEERRCGATMPALAAMMTEKYRRKYRLTAARLEKLLCAVAMKNHLNGARNPYAQFRQPISREQYLASKFVATPLRLYDCAPITDGAAALILTAEATDLWVSGIGQGTAPLSMRERAEFTSFPATQIAARRAYAMAGARPESIDFAEVHDAFTAFEIIGTEDLGFFSPGEGGDAIEHGRTAVDGTLPINASGGLKARGHPVGASGIAQIVETARLLRGSADVELKREPRRGLSQSTGGLAANNFVTIVERRRDGTRVKNLWPGPLAVSQPAPIGPVPLENVINEEEEEEEGKIETFTILHVTPDGFLPPLGLALIRGRRGSMIMGQAEHIDSLAIGKTVYLRKTAGIYTFTVKSNLQSVRA
ncbi:MAG TPA: beta-ketoacyl synthase N-terminal-like domain-containing protein, partial [Candidatus Eisenbacteria bacterium]|nr:beta-ketoacyl synthase N-terminal-like domain-containing protein [Candidatus Eisenbacteria bacterium]